MVEKDIKILIIDDFATMRKIIRTVLKDLGFTNLEEAADGSEAIEFLKTKGADSITGYKLILCDWNMPDITGLEVVKFVKTNKDLKDIPVIMVTSEATKEHIVEAIQAGVNDYIVKPFTGEILIQKIESTFKKLAEQPPEGVE